MGGATLADVASALRRARDVTVIGHLRPDADAVGSVTALVRALRRIGVAARGQIGQEDALEPDLLSIPGAGEIRMGGELIAAERYAVLDCASLDRTGALAGQLKQQSEKMVVIDHHGSNPGFGGLNLVDTSAESTTTILAGLFAELGVSVDEPELAHDLYAGLVTDTGSFRWGSTRMHRLAAEWMDCGLDPRAIAADLMDSVSVADLGMIGRVLSTAQMRRAGSAGVVTLSAAHADVTGHPKSALDVVIDMVTAVRGADVAAVFKELSPGRWSVSLRAPSGDVSEVAAALGGGGHRAAAGYTGVGDLEDVIAELLEGVRECQALQKTAGQPENPGHTRQPGQLDGTPPE